MSRKIEYGAGNAAMEAAKRSWAMNLCNDWVFERVQLRFLTISFLPSLLIQRFALTSASFEVPD
jgi:hypothetical protein